MRCGFDPDLVRDADSFRDRLGERSADGLFDELSDLTGE